MVWGRFLIILDPPKIFNFGFKIVETSFNSPQSNCKGTFSKIHQEIGCFQNGPKSTKSMDDP